MTPDFQLWSSPYAETSLQRQIVAALKTDTVIIKKISTGKIKISKYCLKREGVGGGESPVVLQCGTAYIPVD